MSRRYLSVSIGIFTAVGVAFGCTAKERDFDKLVPRGGSAGATEQATGGTDVTEGGAAGSAGSGNTRGLSGGGVTGLGGRGEAGTEPATGGSVGGPGGAAGSGGSVGVGGTVGGAGGIGVGGSVGVGGGAGQGGAAGQGAQVGSGGEGALGGEAGAGPQAGGPSVGGSAGEGGVVVIAGAGGVPPECVPVTDTEVACDNLEDDDCDTLVDCDDDDCANDSICSFTCVATGAEICNDLQDNDCDEAFDCQDPDCAEDPACVTGCVSTVELVCNDGEDDDCDGFVDCDDEDCKEALNCLGACLPTGPEPDTPQGCSDTLDNNCDGFVDCMDSQCAPTASCCSPTVPATEVCNDGVDNNCDGIIDCPVIVNTFPPRPPSARTEFEGGAAAGHHVLIELAPPVAPDFVVQCRTAHRNQINTATFQVCNPDDPRGLVVHPISPEQAQDPALNGRLQTQVRYAYPNGAVSQIAVHTYYVHSSLANVEPCPPRASDEAFFEVAAADLDQGLGFSGNDARLAAPFVNIDFTPPISAIYEIAEGDGTIEVLSLRRRFVLHDSYRLLLMTRVYPSRRSGSCVTAMIRKHQNDPGDDSDRDQNRYARNSCDALVFNKAGAGVCLNVDSSGTPYLAFSPSSYWRINNSQFKSQLADNFMWRKLLRVNSANGTLKMFSPKCYAGGETCTGGDRDVLFLPDRDLFPALNP